MKKSSLEVPAPIMAEIVALIKQINQVDKLSSVEIVNGPKLDGLSVGSEGVAEISDSINKRTVILKGWRQYNDK